jgi:hypothetical protein
VTIVHGRSDTRVRTTATHDLVHVEVSDDDRRPLLQAPEDDALSGRGLSVLETSASRWRVDDADIAGRPVHPRSGPTALPREAGFTA